MKKQLGLLMGLAIVGGIALPASGGGGAAVSMEKSLLNIRILQSYKKVLARYGQPNRIYQRGEAFDFIPAVDVKGNPTGGVKGLADMEQPAAPGANAAGGFAAPGGMMGGRPGMGMMGGGSMGGAPMMGMPPGMAGMGGRMGGGGSMGMMMGGRPGGSMGGGKMGAMGGGSMGMAPGGSMGGGMMTGAGSMGMMPGAPSGGGGMMGGAGAPPGDGYGAAGGYVWVYLFREKELAYTFHFNKDGRVEMIGQFGWRLGVPTSKKLKLGDPVRSVYSTYGYPDNMLQQGNVLTLLYNQKHHAQFDVQNNKVTGIAIFLHESQKFERGGGGGGAGMGGGMGRLAGSGMGGGSMGMMGGRGAGGGGAGGIGGAVMSADN